MGSASRVRAPAGALLLILALAVSTSCSSTTDDAASTASPSSDVEPTPTSEPSSSSSAQVTEAPRRQRDAPYEPHPSEVDGAAKRIAARAVEALPGVRRVTYTQYFGYLPPDASILVEADFVSGGGTTYEVPISRTAGGWQVGSVNPAVGQPPLPAPGALIRRVLGSDRIVLPWAGRADIAAGLVSESVLRSMLAVAQQHHIGVSVLISAHPVKVFGTDRRSSHPDGLAYDIGSIDGRLVVDPTAAGRVREVMRMAAATGAYQVGGPEDLDGDGSQYFSDQTHSEHVHVGFSR